MKKVVKVYRNLRHGRNARPLYSIVYKGKVISRRHRVLLSNAKFIVRESGRQCVLKTGHKNVHAFVVGVLCGPRGCYGRDANGKDFGTRLKYNPFDGPCFVYDANGFGYDGDRVNGAGGVLLNENGISATYIY